MVQIVQPGNVIASFSPPNALELFYLRKVIESGIAKQDIYDTQNHVIKEGSPYLSVCYYKKKPTGECGKNRNIIYKQSRVRGPVYVLPAQVMSSQVDVTFIGTDIHLQMSEYQWLCDSIGQF